MDYYRGNNIWISFFSLPEKVNTKQFRFVSHRVQSINHVSEAVLNEAIGHKKRQLISSCFHLKALGIKESSST
ncbi:hypothetical protein AKJ16_DCAP08850 [Drosera capensis]